MKRFLFKHNIALALMVFAVIGCTDYEQNYPEANKPIITPTPTITIAEGETGAITLTLSRAIGSHIDLKMMVVEDGGTASDDDYSVDAGEYTSPDDGVGPVPAYHVVIPTGVTTYDIPITAIDDIEIEGEETVTFRITTSQNMMGVIEEDSQLVTVTFTNKESSDFLTRLSWDGTYTDADGEEHAFCDFDLDLEIYTEDFSDAVATSYTHCPEEIRIAPGELEDGTYHIVPSFYTNAGTAPAENLQIPAEMTFSQPGAQIVTEDISDVWDYETGGYEQGNEDGAYYTYYTLTVSGSSFTVTDPEGNVVHEQ